MEGLTFSVCMCLDVYVCVYVFASENVLCACGGAYGYLCLCNLLHEYVSEHVCFLVWLHECM